MCFFHIFKCSTTTKKGKHKQKIFYQLIKPRVDQQSWLDKIGKLTILTFPSGLLASLASLNIGRIACSSVSGSLWRTEQKRKWAVIWILWRSVEKWEVIPPIHVPLFSTPPVTFEYFERSAYVCLIMHYSEALPGP